MKRGTPCIYRDEKNHCCTEYDQRPQLCKDYLCYWVSDKDRVLPERLKPSICNFILSFTQRGQYKTVTLNQVHGKEINYVDLIYVMGICQQSGCDLTINFENKGLMKGVSEDLSFTSFSIYFNNAEFEFGHSEP